MAIEIKQYVFPALLLLQLIIDVACQNDAEPIIAKVPLKFRYFIFSEECYHSFFVQKNFINVSCLKLALSKLLGFCIIAGAFLVKIPQIVKILQKKSTLGVSFEATILEQITQTAAMAYNIYRQNPFTVYGQTMVINFQMMIIHLLFIVFDKEKRVKALAWFPPVVIFFLAGYFPQYKLFPEYILQNTMIFQMIVYSAARLSQIYEIHKIKSTGSVAFITYALAVTGNTARVFTSLVEVKDYILVLSFVLAFVLNFYICLCFWIFKESKNKKEEIKKE